MLVMHFAEITIFFILFEVFGNCNGDSCPETPEEVKRLAKLIEEGLTNATTYEPLTNANMFKPTDDKVTEYGSFDFVIVGGGTTGSVIARRLSERNNFTILVLEAGRWPDYSLLQFLSYLYPSTLSEYNWGFMSVPQTGACQGMVDKRCRTSLGKGMGGTTLINGGVYSRADPLALNKWADISKDSSWSYSRLLPLYKKSENFFHTNPWVTYDKNSHGTDGPLNVVQGGVDELTGVFLEANKLLGYNISDYNGPDHHVASMWQYYNKHGRRFDTGAAFVKPVVKRKNLKVLTESFVIKVEIDKSTKTAKGVTFTRHGKIHFVEAKKEVILSAGVFASPHLLMLSGVGPKEHLKEKGIDVIEDLVGVGRGVTDDVINQSCLFSYLSKLYIPTQTLEDKIADYLHGVGTLTTGAPSHGVAWYKSEVNKNSDLADLMLYCLPNSRSSLEPKITNWESETYYRTWGNESNALQMTIMLVNPKSRGTIKLQSNSPYDYPLIDLKLLSDPQNEDIAVMYDGIKRAFSLMETSSFKRFGVKYIGSPLPQCRNYTFMSKDYWYCFLRYTSSSGYHTSGSCRMGADRSNGVVNNNLEVFGIRKLRVADASVFPLTVAGPPSVTCIMIGEKISEVIKSRYN
ncbi:L-sorbose 1-dehydrogenase isoform X2 [Leptinotarsa decemlineata]|uniref:L-sorbose 1-dehydrogenase isoform X2 n=1 Tax=Leptinotarsa decemlineata TaxID=7539 RepID=UPI003D308B0E